MMKMELPSPVLHSLFALNKAGYEAFVVGGCVRDGWMGKQPTDWDITTSALPEETLAVFRDYRTIETGIQHGTVTVIVEDTPLEITTYRVDGDYSDGRHPDSVSFTRSLTEDLKRRDFTVNAMAYHPQIGLVDPFHGQRDLHQQVIRCVGDPKKRFSEDALRILRGLRFSSTLNFTICHSTSREIHRLAESLLGVSAERISTELMKLLCGVNVESILYKYDDVLSAILPDIHFRNAANRVSSVPADPLNRLTALMYDLTPAIAETCCRRMKLSTRMTKAVAAILRYRELSLMPTQSDVLQALNKLEPELLHVLLSIRRVTDRCNYDAFHKTWNALETDNALCYRIKDLDVTGEDLIAIGIPKGQKIGATLAALLAAVMTGACPNQKETLLELARKKPVQ